jgi:hypothetical protein
MTDKGRARCRENWHGGFVEGVEKRAVLQEI